MQIIRSNLVLLHKNKFIMKQISDLMPLATLEDLREFCLDYARKDKKFNKELTVILNERFIDDEDSAADFIARLEDATHIQFERQKHPAVKRLVCGGPQH